jgi:hypothetical protein
MFASRAGSYHNEAQFRSPTHGRLLALPANTRQGWKGLLGANTLAYWLPPSVLSGRVGWSSSGDRRVIWLRKSSTAWIWECDKRKDDYKIILNCIRKLMKNK